MANLIGFYTLSKREISRFMKLWTVTFMPTIITTSLYLFIFGFAIVAAFSLFPKALVMSQQGINDSRLALYAQWVLNGMRANASTISTESGWTDDASFLATAGSGMGLVFNSPSPVSKEFPSTNNWLRYKLLVTSTGLVKEVTLIMKSGQFGGFDDPEIIYTELYYMP